MSKPGEAITEETLRGLSLAEVRELVRLAEQHLYDRRCQAHLHGVGPCTAEPPHKDGWHECDISARAAASPAHTATPVRAMVRWRFPDDVVALEHEHEGRRRPGAN
ncbi:hypothetical protein ACIPQA_33665 [Streptomyces sp. NPDC090109]|uniref:hypothetical protein n=1 Tax=Streptomyces sp. NPDC090109 TaxID=3365948 RepID=UPI00380DBD23